MKKKIIPLSILLVFFLSRVTQAAEKIQFLEDIEINSISDKNPFKAQLPPPPERKEMKRELAVSTKTSQKRRNVAQPNMKSLLKKTPPPSEIKSLVTRQKVPEKPNLIISGLVWDSKRPQAIINGEVVDVGDKINGETIEIVSIQQNGVDISYEGLTMQITP